MCTFAVLGQSCEAPAAPKPPGFHTTERERTKMEAEEEKKKENLWALHGSERHPPNLAKFGLAKFG